MWQFLFRAVAERARKNVFSSEEPFRTGEFEGDFSSLWLYDAAMWPFKNSEVNSAEEIKKGE